MSTVLDVGSHSVKYYSLAKLEKHGYEQISSFPFSIKILLEAAARQWDGKTITNEHVEKLARWNEHAGKGEVPFKPSRILLQDFTGVPAIVDLAAMRNAMQDLGGNPDHINPLVPVDLIIDHSIMVDRFGTEDALAFNADMEFKRNAERYKFLRWATSAFQNLKIVPPATGICHQVNLEYLAKLALTKDVDGETLVYPDSLVGCDSHTTMINGLGVVGWGVGGIEAEAGMLGQPLYFITPEVVGFKLTGKLCEGVTATDMTLTITEMLRKKGVVGKIVEFYGTGLASISLPDRATVGNMSPEYGATMGYFPVDEESLNYLRRTGRPEELVQLVEAYFKAQGIFRTDDTPDPMFTDTLELDLSTVVPSVAGPKRPQDRIALSDMKGKWNQLLTKPIAEGGFGLSEDDIQKEVEVTFQSGETVKIGTGSVVISAITSCTNTSNPSVMLAAGLVAKKAVEKGLRKPPYVKSSLTPGSKVVTDYYEKLGLLEPLAKLGYNLAGYGCCTCIGNSGPLQDEVRVAIDENNLTVASVLSGNRNFEGRIHAQVKANFLMSPPLLLIYGLAGRIDIDFENEPVGYNNQNEPVYLKDIWPTADEVQEAIRQAVDPEMFVKEYDNIYTVNERWNELPVGQGTLYEWDEKSTYIHRPPFFTGLTKTVEPIQEIVGAKSLALLGDSVTTDHISPAGSIAKSGPAGIFLQKAGVDIRNFNSYGSRRGNDLVMTRGTFANIRIRNQMVSGTEGGYTKYLPTGETMPIYDAAMKYKDDGTPLIVIAGKEYGTGSSRDWAAKGTLLLGVKAVIAESFERIHRSNLVGMGVLPLQFKEAEGWKSLGVDGSETFDVLGMDDQLQPGQMLTVKATRTDGSSFDFEVITRLDSTVDVEYYRNGGILQTVLRQMA
ncbi:aconitate hydratase AcnA [Alicyclobacillus mengziensis]|uniref:Aconitate hydratase n=2 Tax=Alicyclobacillus mengziensis TaxID=2931921 RepID=A0A9X7W3D6_9BACL|nr:aconitate hydratase AcnA [Alicyclobacillus mengziensis]QSO50008.1 aconitate hydratase AcnA [Alicyclobacillus mengziensis]